MKILCIAVPLNTTYLFCSGKHFLQYNIYYCSQHNDYSNKYIKIAVSPKEKHTETEYLSIYIDLSSVSSLLQWYIWSVISDKCYKVHYLLLFTEKWQYLYIEMKCFCVFVCGQKLQQTTKYNVDLIMCQNRGF